MSLTACGTPMIHCFTHLYFFWRQGAIGLALRVAIAIAIYTKASFNIPFIL
jgi:hypothetical protein